MYTFPDQMNWQFVEILMNSKFHPKQSGISLNLRTGPTGHATLFNQWEGALVFINKQIKTSPQWSKIFKTADGVGQNQSSFRGSQALFLSGQCIGSRIGSVSWNIQHILWLISSFKQRNVEAKFWSVFKVGKQVSIIFSIHRFFTKF